MHNTYISSTIYALRSKGSLSFSFNDYSYLLNERFDGNPFQTSFSRCCCCSCCGFSTQKVPINPCYLYGPRQSTLLQWSASRKLILGGGDRCYYHCSPICGIDRDFYDFSCSLKERSFCNTSRRRSKGRCCCVVDKGDGGMYDSRRLNDAEALLSLLSEEVDEDYVFRGKRRNWSSYKRVEVKGKGGFSSSSSSSRERSLGLSDRAQAKKRVNNDGICNCGKKKVDGLRSEEGNTKRGYESIRIESRGEELRRNRDRGAISRGENRRLRKDNPSCSSYYSLSSSGDFDDETDVHDKHTLLAEESLSGYEDSELKGEGKFDGQTTEKYEGYADDIHEQGKVSDQRKTTIVDDVEWDQRKKTEKKCSDRLGQEIQHGRESSQRQSQVSGFRRSSYEKTSSSHKQFNDEEDTSTSAVSLDKRTRKQYAQNENRVVEASTSRRKFAEKKEIQEFHRDDIKRTSQSHIRVGSTGEKDEQQKEVSYVAEEENSNRNNQQVRRFSEAQDFDTQRTTISQNRSEIGVIGVEGYRENVSSSLQGREQSQHKTSQEAVQQADMRRKSQQDTKISKIYDTNIDRTSVMQSETNILNQVQNTNLISISHPGSMEPNSQTAGQRPPQRIQSGRGSHDVNDMTVVHSSENERVTDSQRADERRVHQESEATSVVKLVGETREGFTQRQIRSKKELEEVSTSQEPLILDSEARMLKDDADERVQRSSQTILMPPPSQFLSKSSLHVELASGVENQKVSSSIFESGSSSSYPYPRIQPPALQQESYERNESAEAHREPLYLITSADALASADRLQQSSAQFVGEFVEKVRHEVSTSEIQKVAEVSELTLASEADKDGQNKLMQYASKDFRPKEHDKGHSSSGSGTKGPSDEMWDVSDPSRSRIPREEKTEPTTTIENAIIKRSGRSLWNIIADIVTLRWGSRPETPSSTGRSGRKVSQNESVPSESWFSAHESEQSKDKHAQDKGLPLETMSDQLLVTTLSTPGQGTESVVLELTEHRGDLEPEPSSSTSMMQSRSTSKGISSSGDENLGWNDDGRSLGGSPSGMEIVELSSQPTARSENSTILSQISDTRNTKSGLVGTIEQYNPAKSTEILGAAGNSGELKRRKLQRNKQVPKDRFEEWEEAYILESGQRKIDEMFMREALLEAKKAADTWEVPVGAVLVQHGKIIARGYNLVEELRDSTAHAEMICIREASNQLRTWRLADTTLYVTLEPCPMCAGAILQARITTLVWGAPNKLLGADGSWIRLFPDGEGGNNSEASEKPAAPVHPFHPKMNIRRGILASDCAEVMQQFFQLRRKKKEKQTEEAPSSQLSSSHPSKLLKKMHDVFHLMFCL